MAGQIIRRPLFVEDVRSAWAYITEENSAAADASVRELEKRYQILAVNPLLGVQRFPKYPNLRMFPFRQYIIIYDPLANGSGVELIRFLHAARDYHRFFDD
ncbi:MULTISPECIES: type II toxin-antitoxin system RelE/ParE family toxin [unclassified Rhizobium]|uniref:type II toxin-antitoxin system RelE/ParE family toxin n=1 Tax=unclassified Rhizobium TaxID=2613769 RepID=UPI000EAAAE5A|nr:MULTISPECIES: type II toxin-antitoxin system RelE/ParE family toxin [unclassified Rhizobium]AYG66349.1 type II toxin-antitoxin system RelE/ParE family toxin [Rhizobium sp. CCGE531]AYG72730.1 type II toxin-antitoxin system RelE/ParE family toxin [Rhizobium sp. CCGE532]